MRSRVVLLAGLALLLAPTAAAAPGDVALSAAFPFQATGDVAALGHGALHVQGDAGQLELTLSGAGQATRVVHRAYGLASDDPAAQVLVEERVQRIPLDLAASTLSLVHREPGFEMLATDSATTLTADGEPLLVGALGQSIHVQSDLAPPLSLQVWPSGDEGEYAQDVPAGQFEARITHGGAATDGPLHLFLTGADVRVTGPAGTSDLALRPHTQPAPGTLYNPLTGQWTGPGQHNEYVQEFLVVDLRDAHLQLAASNLPVLAYSPSLHLVGTGQLLLPAAAGAVHVQSSDGTTEHAIHGQDLWLSGRFDLALTKPADQLDGAQVSGTGDFTQVKYGTVAAAYPWGIAAAVGLGAVAVAAGAWLLSQGKILGGGAGLVAGYARVHGQEILQHPGRQETYERVKAQPGISFHDLQAQVGFGASTLTYHLRVLEKNGFVTSLKDGRYLRFFDRHDAQFARDRKHAVSTLRNVNTAAIARHIREHPGVAQHELAARFGVTASTVSWHVRRLGQVGLVQAQRAHPHTRYYAGEAWSSLPASEQMLDAVATA